MTRAVRRMRCGRRLRRIEGQIAHQRMPTTTDRARGSYAAEWRPSRASTPLGALVTSDDHSKAASPGVPRRSRSPRPRVDAAVVERFAPGSGGLGPTGAHGAVRGDAGHRRLAPRPPAASPTSRRPGRPNPRSWPAGRRSRPPTPCGGRFSIARAWRTVRHVDEPPPRAAAPPRSGGSRGAPASPQPRREQPAPRRPGRRIGRRGRAPPEHGDHALDRFQGDVAGKAVGDDHVGWLRWSRSGRAPRRSPTKRSRARASAACASTDRRRALASPPRDRKQGDGRRSPPRARRARRRRRGGETAPGGRRATRRSPRRPPGARARSSPQQRPRVPAAPRPEGAPHSARSRARPRCCRRRRRRRLSPALTSSVPT